MRIALVAAVIALLAAAAPAAAERFGVTYEGGGDWRTTFHATPPNPDGNKDDVNDARDSSRQTWDIRFRQALEIPACEPGTATDPCAGVQGVSGARGATSMTGRVNHKHDDGIYRELDRKVRCRLAKRPSKRRPLDVTLSVRYLPETQAFAIAVSSPMTTTISLFPTACPKQGDSIDRVLDFYATPGFSFADGWGHERWFASREVTLPAADFQRGRRIRIPLSDTRAGTPPRRCAVPNPSYERCRTGGDWHGVLTLTPKPSTDASAAKAVKAAFRAVAKIATPRGRYTSRTVELRVSSRSIDLAAFTFKCRATTGRISLNALRLKKTRRGWRLPATRIFGSATYADDHPDENARVDVSGRFSSTARSARGTLRVKSPHCGDTGARDWSARRR
jgi:hypothetical protein